MLKLSKNVVNFNELYPEIAYDDKVEVMITIEECSNISNVTVTPGCGGCTEVEFFRYLSPKPKFKITLRVDAVEVKRTTVEVRDTATSELQYIILEATPNK